MPWILATAILCLIRDAPAQVPIDLGSASNFAVLAGSGIIFGASGTSIVDGDIGSFPTATIAGTENLVLTGGAVNHGGDAVAQQAHADLATAYAAAAGLSATFTFDPIYDLGGDTLTSGVYRNPSSFEITLGSLTLDGGGNPDAVWIFQAGSTFTTATGSHVLLINGAQAGNVFWQVGTSATIGTSSDFSGNILAHDSITVNTGASVEGRVLALDAAASLDFNDIALPSSIPEPASAWLLGSGLAALLVLRRRKKRPSPPFPSR